MTTIEKATRRGGKRPGAGRPPAGRHQITLRVNDEEEKAVKKFLSVYKGKSQRMTKECDMSLRPSLSSAQPPL